ncbi:MAG: hypothetical protein QXG99_08090 [Conexivisphaerales archaeon]
MDGKVGAGPKAGKHTGKPAYLNDRQKLVEVMLKGVESYGFETDITGRVARLIYEMLSIHQGHVRRYLACHEA